MYAGSALANQQIDGYADGAREGERILRMPRGSWGVPQALVLREVIAEYESVDAEGYDADYLRGLRSVWKRLEEE